MIILIKNLSLSNGFFQLVIADLYPACIPDKLSIIIEVFVVSELGAIHDALMDCCRRAPAIDFFCRNHHSTGLALPNVTPSFLSVLFLLFKRNGLNRVLFLGWLWLSSLS